MLDGTDADLLREALDRGYQVLGEAVKDVEDLPEQFASRVANFRKRLVDAAEASGVAAAAVSGQEEAVIVWTEAGLGEVLKRMCPIWPFC